MFSVSWIEVLELFAAICPSPLCSLDTSQTGANYSERLSISGYIHLDKAAETILSPHPPPVDHLLLPSEPFILQFFDSWSTYVTVPDKAVSSLTVLVWADGFWSTSLCSFGGILSTPEVYISRELPLFIKNIILFIQWK